MCEFFQARAYVHNYNYKVHLQEAPSLQSYKLLRSQNKPYIILAFYTLNTSKHSVHT